MCSLQGCPCTEEYVYGSGHYFLSYFLYLKLNVMVELMKNQRKMRCVDDGSKRTWRLLITQCVFERGC